MLAEEKFSKKYTVFCETCVQLNIVLLYYLNGFSSFKTLYETYNIYMHITYKHIAYMLYEI